MTNSDTVIDPQAQARLQEWGGAKLLSQMIKLFLENAPVRVDQVKKGLAEGSLKDTERGAHSLKSSAANVGAVTVSRIAAEIEELAGAADTAAITALVPKLEVAFGLAREQLAATLAGAESGT